MVLGEVPRLQSGARRGLLTRQAKLRGLPAMPSDTRRAQFVATCSPRSPRDLNRRRNRSCRVRMSRACFGALA